MPPKYIGEDVLFMVNGNLIGTMQTAKLKCEPEEKEIKNGENLTLLNREFTVTLKDVEINEEFIGKTFSPNKLLTVIGTGYKLPRGNKLPKKKRIHKKWMKKYKYELKLENCTIR